MYFFERSFKILAFQDFQKFNPTTNVGKFLIELLTNLRKRSHETLMEEIKPVDVPTDDLEDRDTGVGKDFIFAFSDYQMSDDRRNKICPTFTGFHSFKTFGWDFDGETNTTFGDNVSVTEDFQKNICLRLPSMKVPSQ